MLLHCLCAASLDVHVCVAVLFMCSATGVEGAPAAASYRNASSDDGDVIEAGLKSTASLFASIPASGASLQGLARRLTTTGHDFMPPVSPANMELSTSSAGEGGLFKTRSANVGARSVAAGNSNKHLGGTMSYQPQVGGWLGDGCVLTTAILHHLLCLTSLQDKSAVHAQRASCLCRHAVPKSCAETGVLSLCI